MLLALYFDDLLLKHPVQLPNNLCLFLIFTSYLTFVAFLIGLLINSSIIGLY